MRPAAQWFLLSSVLSLALGVTLREYGENQLFTSPADCCDIEKALPLIGKQDPKTSCVEFVKDASLKSDKDCRVECNLSKNGVLNADKTIKQAELRALLFDNVHPDAKSVLQSAMNECFQDYNSSVKIDSCDSGADLLFLCIAGGVIMDCPDKMRWKSKPQCHDNVDLYRSAADAALGKK